MSRRVDTVALAIGVALLALGPLLLTLARADDYQSSTVVSLNADNASARYLPDPRGLLAGPLKLKDPQREIAEAVEWFGTPADLPDYVRVTSQGGGAFAVTARGPAPEEARQLAVVAARELREGGEAAAAFTQPFQLKQLRRALRRDDLSPARRDELLTRRSAIARSVREDADIYAANATPATVQSERIGDRLLEALPGSRPFRPNPFWAGAAGVALAGALMLWALALGSPRAHGRAPTRG